MLVWTLVIGLFVVFGGIGLSKGGVRMMVSFVGFILAFYLAGPLSPLAAKLLPTMEVTQPIAKLLLPPLIAFVVVNLVFIGLSFYIHHLVEMHFKYKTDDVHFESWRRLNARLGIFVGLVTAGVYAIAIGLFVYVAGYVSVQVASGDNDPGWFKALNQARTELKSSGLDRTVAMFDKTSPKFYETADLVGLIYNNPLIWGKIATYPQFISLTERQDFQEIGSDTDFLTLLQSQAPVPDILNHARSQALLENAEMRDLFNQIDLKDLHSFLQTGKSAKYEEEKLLGNWRMDPAAVLTLSKRARADITPTQMIMVKRLATSFLANLTMKVGADNQFFVKLNMNEEGQRVLNQAIDSLLASQGIARDQARPAAQAAPGPFAGMSPEMARRYGQLAPGGAQSQNPDGTTAPPPPDERAKARTALQPASKGTWAEDGSKYKITFIKDGNPPAESTARIENDRLIIPQKDIVWVLVRD